MVYFDFGCGLCVCETWLQSTGFSKIFSNQNAEVFKYDELIVVTNLMIPYFTKITLHIFNNAK